MSVVVGSGVSRYCHPNALLGVCVVREDGDCFGVISPVSAQPAGLSSQVVQGIWGHEKKTSKNFGKRIDAGWGGHVAFARRREMLRRERLSSRSR